MKDFFPPLYSCIAIPYRLKRHYYNHTSRIVKLLLFPSYIFIETERIEEFVDNIKWFPGFNMNLHIDDIYCPVYEHEVVILNRLIAENDIIDISQGYMEGDKVHVTNGPLVGMEGQIRKVKPRQRAAILDMNIINRKTEVSLALELIEKNNNKNNSQK